MIDWETVNSRSIFFDVFNFFIPWFTRRSYDYFEIKKFILNFIENYLPNLESLIQDKYDLYFNLFVLERFSRIKNSSAFLLDKEELLKGLIISLKTFKMKSIILKVIKNNYFFKILFSTWLKI